MKNPIAITALVLVFTFSLFVVACRKQSTTTLSPYYETVKSYKGCLPYPIPTPIYLNGHIVGMDNTHGLNVMSFKDRVAFEEYILGPVSYSNLEELTTSQSALLLYQLAGMKEHNEKNYKQVQSTKVKVFRKPDCHIDPKVCPCVDTDMDSQCIELPN